MEVEIKELAARPLIGIRSNVPKNAIGDLIPGAFGQSVRISKITEWR